MRWRSLLVALALLAACKADPYEEWLRRQPGPPVVPATAACDSLTGHECLVTSHCRLVGRGPVYVCRPASGVCEIGFAQTDRAACEKHPECRFVPADCYCGGRHQGATKVPDDSTPEFLCDCGSGPPASCVAKRAGPVSP